MPGLIRSLTHMRAVVRRAASGMTPRSVADVLAGDRRGLGAIAHFERGQHLVHVLVDRANRDAQPRSDFSVGATEAHLLEYLSLAWAQTADPASGSRGASSRSWPVLRSGRAACSQAPDRADHLRDGHGFM